MVERRGSDATRLVYHRYVLSAVVKLAPHSLVPPSSMLIGCLMLALCGGALSFRGENKRLAAEQSGAAPHSPHTVNGGYAPLEEVF